MLWQLAHVQQLLGVHCARGKKRHARQAICLADLAAGPPFPVKKYPAETLQLVLQLVIFSILQTCMAVAGTST